RARESGCVHSRASANCFVALRAAHSEILDRDFPSLRDAADRIIDRESRAGNLQPVGGVRHAWWAGATFRQATPACCTDGCVPGVLSLRLLRDACFAALSARHRPGDLSAGRSAPSLEGSKTSALVSGYPSPRFLRIFIILRDLKSFVLIKIRIFII